MGLIGHDRSGREVWLMVLLILIARVRRSCIVGVGLEGLTVHMDGLQGARLDELLMLEMVALIWVRRGEGQSV